MPASLPTPSSADPFAGRFTTRSAPGGLPLTGHAWPLMRRPWEFLQSLSGELVELRLPQKVYVAAHPELLHHVLTHDRTFDKGGIVYDRAREILGNGLVSCPYPDHRRQRRLIQPAFTRGQIAHYGPAVEQEIAALTDSWEPGQVIDVYPVFYGLALRSLISSLFAVRADDRSVAAISGSLEIIMGGVARRMFTPEWVSRLPTRGNRRYDGAVRRLHGEVDRLIEECKARGADQASLLSLLVASREEEGVAGLSDAEIHDQVIGMLHAGSETTAMALTWALYRLTEHPEVQRRLQEEADAVLDGRAARFADVPQLGYAGRLFTETLRVYPPAWAFTRTVTERTELAGRTLKPGTTIVCCSLATHQHEGLYVRPDDFEPDRWLPGRPDSAPRSALTSFGGGARRCIGDIYAMNEAAATLSTIAARWHLTAAPGSDPRLTPMTIGIYPRRLLIQLNPRATGRGAARGAAQAVREPAGAPAPAPSGCPVRTGGPDHPVPTE